LRSPHPLRTDSNSDRDTPRSAPSRWWPAVRNRNVPPGRPHSLRPPALGSNPNLPHAQKVMSGFPSDPPARRTFPASAVTRSSDPCSVPVPAARLRSSPLLSEPAALASPSPSPQSTHAPTQAPAPGSARYYRAVPHKIPASLIV